jgi:predicted nucleic acid-binding protein
VTPDQWDGRGPVIADTSAWITARRIPIAREAMLGAVERGDIAWCWPVRYELTVDARDAEAITALDRPLDALREIRVDWAMQREVLSAMREFARHDARGAHRLPLTDLTVAVAARRSGLDVVHFDRRFERLGALLDIGVWWLADPSSA